ncbi:MAG: GatB/YqeY domain-containing protein [Gammaproteobacteria bacterium]|nr:GatB/YqeY domain-containing protein [Gammaproteobacteria bacterium]
MPSILMLQIQEDTKNAMRAKEAQRLATIRLLLAAIKQREVDERISLDDNQIIAVIDKMIKQRNDSIEQYIKGDRKDLAQIEEAELEILKKYMPQPLTEEEIENIIVEAVSSSKATSIKDMARVMTHLRPKVQGRADMGKVSAKIKNILENKA